MITNPSQLLTAVGLAQATSEVEDGNMSLRWGATEEVVPARQRFLKAIQLKLDDTIGGRFDGSTDIVEVLDGSFAGRGMKESLNQAPGDAVIIKERNLGIFMFAGDCPIAVLYDPVKGILGMAHLSRKTSDLGIAGKTVASMVSQGSAAKDIIVWIGPGIKEKSYIFPRKITDFEMDWSDYLREEAGGAAVDLFGFNKNEFIKSGVVSEHIEISPVDTYSDSNFFSHVRSVKLGEPEGRFAVIAVMR